MNIYAIFDSVASFLEGTYPAFIATNYSITQQYTLPNGSVLDIHPSKAHFNYRSIGEICDTPFNLNLHSGIPAPNLSVTADTLNSLLANTTLSLLFTSPTITSPFQ